jgi:hypothetical protein
MVAAAVLRTRRRRASVHGGSCDGGCHVLVQPRPPVGVVRGEQLLTASLQGGLVLLRSRPTRLSLRKLHARVHRRDGGWRVWLRLRRGGAALLSSLLRVVLRFLLGSFGSLFQSLSLDALARGRNRSGLLRQQHVVRSLRVRGALRSGGGAQPAT